MSGSSRNWIPRRDGDFAPWIDNFVLVVVKNAMASATKIWDHIPLPEIDTLVTAHTAWKAAWAKLAGPHTHVDVVNKDTARAALEPIVRSFRFRFLDNWQTVTPGHRAELQIPTPDREPTAEPVPTDLVEAIVDSSVICKLGFRLRALGSTHWAKPEHVHSADFRWAQLDARPGSVDELAHQISVTDNHLSLTFDEADRGKRIFYAARWMNNTMQPGPWSDIESAIIP